MKLDKKKQATCICIIEKEEKGSNKSKTKQKNIQQKKKLIFVSRPI